MVGSKSRRTSHWHDCFTKRDRRNRDIEKVFFSEAYRGREFGISQKLYETLLDFAKKEKFVILLLDSPAEAKRSHAFYRKMGFQLIGKDALPISYTYPDRNSCIFSLKL